MRSKVSLDLSALFEQLRTIDLAQPEWWPREARRAMSGLLLVAVLALGWSFHLAEKWTLLQAGQDAERLMKEQFSLKLGQAASLPALRQRVEAMKVRATQLAQTVPTAPEMDALLADINRAGMLRGLQFDLFKPMASLIRERHVIFPVDIRVSGRYHDVAQFVADVVALPRLVVWKDIALIAGKDGQVQMDAQAHAHVLLPPSGQTSHGLAAHDH